MQRVKKAIIPAAGYGTRLLPFTKAVPKEMLPIVGVPAIHYILDECVASGITDVCIILNNNKQSIVNYFSPNAELDSLLRKSGQIKLADSVRDIGSGVNLSFIYQKTMNGTGKAIELARNFVGNDPFAVLFGDDVMYSNGLPVIKQLINAYESTVCPIVGVQPQPDSIARTCSVVVPGKVKGNYTELRGLIEKPTDEILPSNLTNLGRFVLTPEIFDYIDKTPARNGEVYLPSAIGLQSKYSTVYAYTFEAQRFDIGSKLGYLKAGVELALQSESMKAEMENFIKDISKKYKL